MMRIIINADDLGMNPSANREIEFCIREGLISSSTLLANGNDFEEGVRIAKLYPHISIGAHLNLQEFQPLTHSDEFVKHRLLDESGYFSKREIFKVKRFDDRLLEAIYNEWFAQVKKIVDQGFLVSHFDSHLNTHFIPALQNVLYRLSADFDVNKIRRQSHYPNPANSLLMGLKRIIRGYKANRWSNQISENFTCTDSFTSLHQFLVYHIAFTKGLSKEASIELMCHPGHLRYDYEYKMLKNRELDNILTSFKLISYNEL